MTERGWGERQWERPGEASHKGREGGRGQQSIYRVRGRREQGKGAGLMNDSRPFGVLSTVGTKKIKNNKKKEN